MADSDGDGDGDGDGVGVWIKFLELDEQLTMVENEIEEQEEVIEDLRKEVREAKEEEARIPDEDDYRYGEDAEDDSDEEMDGDGSILNDLEQEHEDAGENLRERRKALNRALNSLTPLYDKLDSILDEYKQLQKKQMLIGSTAIGLKFREGVVLVAENRITVPARPLYQKSMMSIMDIDKHVGIAMTVTRSIAKNARKLVQEAQTLIQNHKVSNNGQPMAVDSMLQALSHRLANQIQPFVESLIASRDENGPPSLYYSDPSGVFYLCNAKAIGLQSEAADTHLEEHSNRVEDLTLENAENIALSILKQVMGEKVTPNNVGIAKIAPTYHPYTRSELEAVISRI